MAGGHTVSDYVEFNPADGWPEELRHLRDDAPYQRCGRCGRKTWDTAAFNTECRMPQPDGYQCGGQFEATS
jgi:hypothetical protein